MLPICKQLLKIITTVCFDDALACSLLCIPHHNLYTNCGYCNYYYYYICFFIDSLFRLRRNDDIITSQTLHPICPELQQLLSFVFPFLSSPYQFVIFKKKYTSSSMDVYTLLERGVIARYGTALLSRRVLLLLLLLLIELISCHIVLS